MKSIYTRILLSFCLLLGWLIPAYSQTVPSIDQLMEGERFVGYSPTNVYWAEDSKKIYFNWNPERVDAPLLYAVAVQNGKIVGKPEKVNEAEMSALPNQFGTYNKSRTQKLYSKNGDIFWYNAPSNSPKGGGNTSIQTLQITNTIESESNPVFSTDEKSVLYLKGGNLYEWNSTTGITTQLTDLRSSTEDKPKTPTKEEKWLEEQQAQLFKIVQKRKEQADKSKKTEEMRRPKRPKAFYLQGKTASNIQLSPKRDFITFRLTQDGKPKNTQVPQWVNNTGFVENDNARPKVGSNQNKYEFAIYDIAKDTIYTLDMKQLEGIYDLPEYYKEYNRKPEKKEAREVMPFGTYWSEDGNSAVLVIRSLDAKDRWIVLLDATTGKLKTLDRQRDEAWIGGPGIGWGGGAGTVGWLSDNTTFYFQSEKTGYSHLYTVHVRTNEIKALTSGKFEIREANLSKDKKQWFLLTNEVHPGEYQFYTMPLNGGTRTRITAQTGMYEVIPSPDEQYLALRYSYSNKPWELYLKPNKAQAPETQITFSPSEDFKKYTWIDPPIVTFQAQDGATVYARLYRPQNPPKQGRAVIFVHGAGYLQNVHKGWSSYYREYMFHNFLVSQGYTVLDIDYRASDGYGRDWRTGIYRHMGGKDLSDHVDGAKFLTEKYDIDPKRIGIYGGSYGGFITLMAMFTQPDVFKAGAGLRSVTDWAHYNHPYTMNILNTPVLDSLAYAKSSPINFAEGLKGKLLLCHGMVDDNVQFQDIVRLAQRLIELRKENWELAVYPIEPHGFVEPSSWADEYKRIFKLFEGSL
jgi:dipeptidyl aminopeptidase/acylaminoacyl peptidase